MSVQANEPLTLTRSAGLRPGSALSVNHAINRNVLDYANGRFMVTRHLQPKNEAIHKSQRAGSETGAPRKNPRPIRRQTDDNSPSPLRKGRGPGEGKATDCKP